MRRRLGNAAVIDPEVQAQMAAGAKAIPVILDVTAGGPLRNVDDELAKVSTTSETTAMAIELKEMEIARSEKKPIDEARFAQLQSQMRAAADASAKRADTVKAEAISHNDKQYKISTDRVRADSATIAGLTIRAVHPEGFIQATATPEAIQRVAALPFISGVLSDRPITVQQGLASAVPNVGATRFWNTGPTPRTGTGVKVSVMDGGAYDHTALRFTAHQNFTRDHPIK